METGVISDFLNIHLSSKHVAQREIKLKQNNETVSASLAYFSTSK